MNFRNYCAVIIGNTKKISAELERISEIPVNFLDGKGLFIATFASILEPSEIKELLVESNRNFLLFELDPDKSSFNINDLAIQNNLFGFIDSENVKELNKKFNDMVYNENKTINRLNINLINKLSVSEKQTILNELIDFGIENLSEDDKKLLPLLAK